MHITITTLGDEIFVIQCSDDLFLSDFKALCQFETGIPLDDMTLFWNGSLLPSAKDVTLKQHGLKDGGVVLCRQGDFTQLPQQEGSSGQRSQGPSSGVPNFDFGNIQIPGQVQQQPPQPQQRREDDPAVIRDMFLSDPSQLALLKERNPPLAEALLSGDLAKFTKALEELRANRVNEEQERIRLLSADPFDPDAQEKIEEAIRQKNIETNMATAMEFAPESFGQVHMLYIDCKVNGHPVKAFVDSGAQMTIMSQQCAERCHIMRLVDRRWAGVAKGVGTQKILGRVHLCQIQIGAAFLQSSFSILENQPMDMLLGLDMLKRHQCLIDLRKNQLEIGTSGTVTPFLSEGDLPEHARLNTGTAMASSSEDDRQLAEALSRSANESGPSTSQSPSTSQAAKFPEESISKITANGFSRSAAIDELTRSRGNVDEALAALLARTLAVP